MCTTPHFENPNHFYGIRAAGILIQHNRILMQREINGTEYAVPGGCIHAGESTQDALQRRWQEETGAGILCRPLAFIEECFWKWHGKAAHTITFYYRVHLKDGAVLPDRFANKANPEVLFEWLPTDTLEQYCIYPSFLPQQLKMPEEGIRHFITKL